MEETQSATGDNSSLVDKARAFFNQGNYVEALTLYTQAIETNATFSAASYVDMGRCYFEMGELGAARWSLENSLHLDARCTEALMRLALIELRQPDCESLARGADLLRRAHDIEPQNPMLLNQLAVCSYIKKEYYESEKLALKAVDLAQKCGWPVVQAESFYYLAQALHAQQKYRKAYQNYYNATMLGPADKVMPHFGMGLTSICLGDTGNAILCFEHVLKFLPEHLETMRILGSLYVYSENRTKRDLGKSYLRKVTNQWPDHWQAWLVMAYACEQDDIGTCLMSYDAAIGILRGLGPCKILPEVLYKFGDLHFRLGNIEASKTFFEEALERCELLERFEPLDDAVHLVRVNANYSLGNVYGELCLMDQERLNAARSTEQMAVRVMENLESEQAASLEVIKALQVREQRHNQRLSAGQNETNYDVSSAMRPFDALVSEATFQLRMIQRNSLKPAGECGTVQAGRSDDCPPFKEKQCNAADTPA